MAQEESKEKYFILVVVILKTDFLLITAIEPSPCSHSWTVIVIYVGQLPHLNACTEHPLLIAVRAQSPCCFDDSTQRLDFLSLYLTVVLIVIFAVTSLHWICPHLWVESWKLKVSVVLVAVLL